MSSEITRQLSEVSESRLELTAGECLNQLSAAFPDSAAAFAELELLRGRIENLEQPVSSEKAKQAEEIFSLLMTARQNISNLDRLISSYERTAADSDKAKQFLILGINLAKILPRELIKEARGALSIAEQGEESLREMKETFTRLRDSVVNALPGIRGKFIEIFNSE